MTFPAAWGGSSLVLSNVPALNGRIPAQSKKNPWRVELYLHDWNPNPAPNTPVALVHAVGFQANLLNISGDVRIQMFSWWDAGGRVCQMPASLLPDRQVYLRFQRDPDAKMSYCEGWSSRGVRVFSAQLPYSGDSDFHQNGAEAGGLWGENRSIGFLRLHTTLIPPNTRSPITRDDDNRVFEWKFDNDLSDASGNGYAATFAGRPVFVSTASEGAPVARPRTLSAPGWSDWIPLRAGQPNQLDGSGSYSQNDDSPGVSFEWTQVDGPSPVQWSNPKIERPIISGLIFGSYRFRLTVTDKSGSTSSSELEVGAVATDEKGLVIYPDERLNALLGPAMAFGKNPWEWFDARQVQLHEYWKHNWEVHGGTWKLESDLTSLNGIPRKGTVFVPSGSNKIYGTKTNFLEVFCGGAPGPAVPNAYIVPKMPTNLPRDTPRPYPRAVASCQSDTELTMPEQWLWERDTVAAPGVEWGTMNLCADCGDWYGGNTPSNINFYDSGLADYALYYRSGWRKARDSARWIADRWYRSPNILSFVNATPRDFGLVSAFIRASVDGGHPDYDMWPALRDFSRWCFLPSYGYLGDYPLSDVRESAYCLGYTALQALLDPDPNEKRIAQERVVNDYHWQWGTQQRGNGNYVGNAFEGDFQRVFRASQGSTDMTLETGPPIPRDYCGVSINAGGTLTLSQDRVTVTGAGTDFTGSEGRIIVLRGTLAGQPWSMTAQIASNPKPTATSLRLIHPWRGDAGSVSPSQWRIYDGSIRGSNYYNQFFAATDRAGQSPVLDEDNWYWCTVVDATTIQLDKPYTGDTSQGNVYRRTTLQNLTGRGSQPFTHGIAAWALNLASQSMESYDPAVSEGYKTAMQRAVDWTWNYGRNPATKGLFYGVDYSNCRNLSILPAHECAQDSGGSSNERSYNVETNGGFAQKFLSTLDASDLQRGDAWYTDQFSRLGFSSPEKGDGAFAELIDECCFRYSDKFYGQVYGLGQGHQWPAARLMKKATQESTPVPIEFDLKSAPGANRARVLVVYPSSAQTFRVCTESPCLVPFDERQGTHWVKVEYMKGDEVIGRLDWRLKDAPKKQGQAADAGR